MLLLLCKINSIVHNPQLCILSVETKFPFTLSICTDRAQFLRLKSILCQSSSLHQSVHIMVMTPHCSQSFLMNWKTDKTINLYFWKSEFFINCAFGSSQWNRFLEIGVPKRQPVKEFIFCKVVGLQPAALVENECIQRYCEHLFQGTPFTVCLWALVLKSLCLVKTNRNCK